MPELPGAWLAAALHAGAALLAGPALGGPHREGRVFASALAVALPGLGLAGLALVRAWIALAPAPEPGAGTHASLENLPAPDMAADPLDSVLEWMQTQLAVQPIGDAIRSEDPAMQRWAIQMLSRRTDGEAVDLLREGLQSANRDIQLLATSALQRIEERLTARMEQARSAVEREPESAAAWAAFGDACRAYQQSRLLEPVMERHWLGEGERAYRRALALAPAPETRLCLARVLAGLARHAEAEAEVRAVAAADPSAEADALLAEILFAQRRWTDLSATAATAVAAGRAHEPLAWWADGADGR